MKKVIISIIVIAFGLNSAGGRCQLSQALAGEDTLRPVAAANSAGRSALKNDFAFPATFNGTDEVRHAKIAQTIKTLFGELSIIIDRSKSIRLEIPAQVEMVIELSDHPVTLYSGEVIRELKIYGDQEWPTFFIPSKECYVTITMDEHPGAYACYQELFNLLRGDELELNEDAGAGLPVKGDSEWNSWNTDDHSIPPDGYNTYKMIIDKYVAKYTLATIREISLSSSRQVINVFDLFGGTGRLICTIDESIRKDPAKYLPKEKHVKYFLADRNARLITIAEHMLAHTNTDIYKLDLLRCKDLEKEMGAKADIVILEGAIIRQVIGTKEDALDIIQKVNKVLSPGGFCIVTGYTGIWLKSIDFQSAGFDILNMSIPHNTLNYLKIGQFYILRKAYSAAQPVKTLKRVKEQVTLLDIPLRSTFDPYQTDRFQNKLRSAA